MRNFFKFTFIFLVTLCAKAQVPTATILAVTPYFCTNTDNFFALQQKTFEPATYSWTIVPARGSKILSRSDDSTVVCTFSLPGLYTLSITITSGSLSSSNTKQISVTRSAIASFNASLTGTGFPNQLSLSDYSSNTIKSYWIFSDTPQKDSSLYLLKDYALAGSYSVALVALGMNGCNDTLDYAFRLSDSSSVTLPNIFSPNDDGTNDLYKPITRGIYKLNCWIYNRYGTLILNWDQVNGSWDGYTTSGLKCSVGEYFVIAEATGFDGKNYKLKTTLSLVR